MEFDYEECRQVLHHSLMSALGARRDVIRELHKVEEFWALSYDILPWDPYVGVAFRLESESGHDASMNSGGWKHSHFIEDISDTELISAREYIHSAYMRAASDGKGGQEAAHLIFLAAADALLDHSVALLLQECGINAPVIGDVLPWNYFKYIVIDEDGVIKANYCDIVCANRVTRRLLGRVV